MTKALGSYFLPDSKLEIESLIVETSRLIGTGACIVGNAGSGKSGLIRRLLEVTFGEAQHIILDAEDEFYTLREKYDYIIFGGDNGDCPISVKGAADLATAILTHGMSAIIQLNSLRAFEQEEFIAAFLGSVMEAPRSLWHPVLVVIDEAHRFVPQEGEAASSEAVKDLVSRGRKRGFTPVLATQRMAKINKNATDSINNWFIGRVGQSTDRKVASDHLGFSPSSEQGRGLQGLDNRNFWGFGPAVARTPLKFIVGQTETTIIPAGGAAVPTPPAPAAMQELLKSLAEAAKAAEAPETPANAAEGAGGAQDVDLVAIRETAFKHGQRHGYAAGMRDGGRIMLENLIGDLKGKQEQVGIYNPDEAPAEDESIADAMERLGIAKREGDGPEVSKSWRDMERMPVRPGKTVLLNAGADVTAETARLAHNLGSSALRFSKMEPVENKGGTMSRPTQAILKTIEDFWPRAVPFLTAAKHAGVGLRSSQFSRYEPELKASGLVECINGHYRAKRDMPTGTNLLELYRSKMMPSWWSIVEAVFGAGGPLTKEEIIQRAGISPTSSTGGAALKALVDDYEILIKLPDGRYHMAEAFQ